MRARRVRVLLCLAVVACGRIGFTTRELRDADTIDGAGACTWSAFSQPVRIPGQANTQADEWAAAPTVGDTQLFFHSYRAQNSDLFVSMKGSNGEWLAATRIAELDNGVDQWTPTLTEDGLDLVYADESTGQYKLWSARRDSASDMFGSAALLPIVNAGAAAQDNHPWLGADGTRLLFMSTRSGMDRVYETTRATRTSEFAPPVPLDLGSGNASNPTLSADGLELFFTSTRGGGLDIWTTRRPAIGQPWAPPAKVNELSSARDDCCMRLSRDGTTMFLDYDTLTVGGGMADIYFATRTCE